MLETTNDKRPLNSLPLPLVLIYSFILDLSLLLAQPKLSSVILTLTGGGGVKELRGWRREV